MLGKLEFVLPFAERGDFGMSSLMHGVLMEYMDDTYGQKLHSGGLNPFTSHLEFSQGKMKWVITALTEEANEQVLIRLNQQVLGEIYIRHKDLSLPVLERHLVQEPYTNLLEKFYLGSCKKYLDIEFITPTAFKVDGIYQFYPTTEHIFGSLIRKHDSNNDRTQIASEDLYEEIKKNVRITRYKLRSTTFSLEGVKIPAFLGSIRISVRGASAFVNLINLLAAYGEYSGVGIKCTLGMGAIRTTVYERKE